MNLLREYLSYIVSEKRASTYVPPEAEGLFPGPFGMYYKDATKTQYMGKVVNQQWVPAKGAPVSSPKLTAQEEEPTTSQSTTPEEEPSTDTNTLEQPPEEPTDTTDVEVPSPIATVPKSDTIDLATEPRAAEVMGNLFSESREIERGGEKTSVRFIVNPETNEPLDITDEQQRTIAIQLLDEHIASLTDQIKAKVKRVNQKISRTERQQLRKWLGNVGELFGLRKMLDTGVEAYLYADSNPKNDIAVVFDYGEDENDKDIRKCMLTGVSTKTSTGTKVGRKESNSLPFIMESVEGKTIQIPGKDGQMEDVYAEDAAVALYAIFNQVYVSSTRGFIVRGTKFKEERAFNVRQNDLFKFDEETLKLAMKQQSEAADKGESGGQKKFVEARKLLPTDIEFAFDKNSKAYTRIVNRVVRNMGEGKTPESIEKAQRLVNHFVDKLRAEVMQKSIDEKGYRLSDTNDFLTQNVVELLQSTNSEFMFQSDLMTVSFDDVTGFSNLTIVPGEVMRQRAQEKFGDIKNMDPMQQLINLGNWEINTRGMGLSSSGGGYLGPLPRVSPSMNILQPTDYLTLDDYLKFLKELHRRRALKQLEEYLWR
jgi:hypothetical protein